MSSIFATKHILIHKVELKTLYFSLSQGLDETPSLPFLPLPLYEGLGRPPSVVDVSGLLLSNLFQLLLSLSLIVVFSFTAIHRSYIYSPSSSLSDELSSLLLSFSKVFSLFRLPFSIKSRWTFLFLIKPLSTPDPQVHLETYSGHEAW